MSKAQEIRNRLEYEERIRELASLIKERAVPFQDDTADKQLERKARARKDPLYWAQTYYPHYFTEEFADFHREEIAAIQGALDDQVAQVIAEVWSRGFGKTCLLTIAFAMWAVHIAKKVKFCIVAGADKDLAKERLAAIKLELQLNARIKHDWPEIVMAEGDGEEHDFKPPDGTRYRAQGYKQAIRGKTHGPHRPRLIIVDDLESHVDQNPEIAEKKLRFVLEEAYGAFGPKGGVLVWLGNLTSKESALSRFVDRCKHETDNPYMRTRIVKAEEDGKSTWPEAYPIEKLRGIEQVMTRTGYQRHYLMQPTPDGKVFKDVWLRFWNVWSIRIPALDPVERVETRSGSVVSKTGIGMVAMPTREELMCAQKVTYCDPSLGAGESNDYKAVFTVAFWGGWYWILDVWVRKATILEMLDYMYQLDSRYPRTRMYMEQNFWQRLIWEYLPQIAVQKKYMLPVCGIENRLKKEERILKMQPLFEWGHIWHTVEGRDWETFKEQLCGFPGAAYDDAPDALSGAIERFAAIAQQNQYEQVEAGNGGYTGMW